MADSRFFRRAGPFSLGRLAVFVKGSLAPGSDQDLILSDVAPLETAGPGDLSFLDNKKYVDAFSRSQASACVIDEALADRAPKGMALIFAKDPYRAYAKLAAMFYPQTQAESAIHPSAVLGPGCVIGDGTRIEAGVVIGAGAEIGERCWIGPNAVIGEGVVIGDDGKIGANATISHAIVGKFVNLYPGVRIGQDGFGFAMGAEGHLKVPQLGRVLIGDDVEIGANSTVDRGAGPDTVIGAGCRIDNLVQIGHNVRLGRGCIIVSQVGVSGSTQIGDFVVIGGQAGITGHLTIGHGARIAAQSGVMRDIESGLTVGGTPAMPQADWLRQSAVLAKMSKRKGP
jgi:UDP-3-O-[3-hydroxymyristoyl] glucosamine N-acyltransferase